jgi:hypothetical protein
VDVNQIAYIYSERKGYVLQFKNKSKIQLSENNSLVTLANVAGMEFFILLNENVLANYDAIRGIIPVDDKEAQVVLRPKPPFEVFTYDDYYEEIKSFMNPKAPDE